MWCERRAPDSVNPAIEYPLGQLEDAREVAAVALLPSDADRDQQRVAPD
jgi:hypothetical protein